MSLFQTLIRSPIIFGSFKVKSEILNVAARTFKTLDIATGYKNIAEIGSSIAYIVDKPLILLKFNSEDFKDFNKSTEETVKQLGKEPEMVLIHSPLEDNVTAFKQLCSRFPNSTKGVSNFDIAKIRNLIDNGCKPDIISLEYSPYYQPHALVKFCNDNNIIVTGYRCLAKGEACKDSLIISLAEKHKASVVDILLIWSLSHNVFPIYSTNNPYHVTANIVSTLSLDDILSIDTLDRGSSAATCMLRYCLIMMHNYKKLIYNIYISINIA